MAQLFMALGTMTAGQAMMAGGTLLSTGGLIKQGSNQKKVAAYNAANLEAQGKSEYAVAQREAVEEKRKKELMISRARAVGAASGGGVDINLLGDIEEEGRMNELTSLWQGEERRKGRNAQAATTLFEGAAAKRASMWKAGSTLLSGGSSFLDSFGSTFKSKYG